MSSSSRTVLVTGATGNQGGAVARLLAARGWRVRALTRDRAGARARALAEAGVEVAAGVPGDRAALDAAVAGARAVFSVQPGALAATPVPYEAEIGWGAAIADAAVAAGVEHLVYSSVAGAEDSAGVVAFEPKLRIEEHIRRIGAPATVLRPVSFMENYADAAFGLGSGVLATALAADVPEQLIAVDDIAAVVAVVLDRPETFLGQTLTIAGDALTPPHMAHAVSTALDRHIRYVPVSITDLRAMNPTLAQVVEFVNGRGGYRADLARSRVVHPGMLTFQEWLDRGGARRIRSLLPASNPHVH